MRSPAAAFAWELTTRQRWILIAIPLYLLAVGVIKSILIGPDETVEVFDGFGAFGVAPFSVTFFYFVAVFSFGLNGDLAARQSIYPARYFTLPIRTSELALWPMVYGAAAMMSLWLLASSVARWAIHMELPWLWPGILIAVVLAWIQVFSWLPYGLRGIRVIAAVAILISLNAVVITAIELEVSERTLIAFLAPQWPLAYLAACRAVALARKGHAPGWSLFNRVGGAGRQALPPFASPARAQSWFEWRRNGQSLPMMVALVLPFQLLLPFITGYGSTWFIYELVIAILFTPVVMAGFAGAVVSKANPFGREVYGVTPFNATRPLTSAELIAAKLKMAMWSTAAAWAIVLVSVPIGFAWSGADSVIIGWARWLIDTVGMPRAVALMALTLAGFVLSTWMMLVQSLYIGLTGREWLVKTSGFVGLVVVMAIGPAFEWISDNVGVRRWLWDSWPAFAAGLVALKMIAASWIAIRLFSSRLIVDRSLIVGATIWVVAVFLLFTVFVWWVDTPMIARHVLLLFAILAVPLVRVAAAPLAFAWNRHR
jgi:hypothetical protein